MVAAPRLVDRLLDLALPASCAGCGREGADLCATCAVALDVRLDRPPGVPIGLPADLPAPLLQLDWCAPFTGVVRAALHALKYRGERRLAEPLGQAVARRWAAVGAGGDVLVPVPVHADRRLERGYDQAVLIADAAARQLRIPMAPALVRERATEAQYRLGRARREANVAGAFGPGPGAAAIVGRWVVLVDDVVTTGSTLAACGAACLAAGALAVSAVCVARER